MTTNTLETPKNNKLSVALNHKHSAKISWKRGQALTLANNIVDYLKSHDVHIPRSIKMWRMHKEELYSSMSAHIVEDTGEVLNVEKEFDGLIKMYYRLIQSGKSLYSTFDTATNRDLQILGTMYSRELVDPVWDYRKSQLIRKCYKNYLAETDAQKKYDIRHLVLTMPHAGGFYKRADGTKVRFFARDLIHCFNELRKTRTWKKYMWGGEYGIETKKSQRGHGLHIHAHVLCFQFKEFSRNEAYEAIKAEWQVITGATHMHFESLYTLQKDSSGAKIYTIRMVQTEDGEWIEKKEYIKKYINQYSTLEEWTMAILEAIKYHFKSQEFQDENGKWDMQLIHEIKREAKGLRMYSRFGGLHDDERLSHNHQDAEKLLEATTTRIAEAHERIKKLSGQVGKTASEEARRIDSIRKWRLKIKDLELKKQRLLLRLEPDEEESKEGTESELQASADTALKNLINPITFEPADIKDYKVVVSYPEKIAHKKKDDATPFKPEARYMPYYEVDMDAAGGELSAVMKAAIKGDLVSMLTEVDQRLYKIIEFERYASQAADPNNHWLAWWKKRESRAKAFAPRPTEHLPEKSKHKTKVFDRFNRTDYQDETPF